MQAQSETREEIINQLKLKSKKGLLADKQGIEEVLHKIEGQGSQVEYYYKEILKEIDAAVERKNKKKAQSQETLYPEKEKPKIKMPSNALKHLCTTYAPELKFSKDALGFLEEIIRIETSQVFKKLKTLAAQRSAKTVKKKDLRALAEMNLYD